jgi:hypothetical protein
MSISGIITGKKRRYGVITRNSGDVTDKDVVRGYFESDVVSSSI